MPSKSQFYNLKVYKDLQRTADRPSKNKISLLQAMHFHTVFPKQLKNVGHK